MDCYYTDEIWYGKKLSDLIFEYRAEIETLDFELPTEIISRILCSIPELMFASISVSKDVRKYSMDNFLKNSRIRKTDIFTIVFSPRSMIITNERGMCHISYMEDGKPVISKIQHPFISVSDTVYLVPMAYYKDIIYNRICNMIDYNDNMLKKIVKDYKEYIKTILPKNAYLFYTLMDRYIKGRDGDFDIHYLKSYLQKHVKS